MRRLLMLSVFACAPAVAACGSGVQNVTVVHVAARDIAATPGGLGKVAAAVDVPVALEFLDTVTAVHVKVGDTVTTGQSLIDLDPAPLTINEQSMQLRVASSRAALARTQADLTTAQAKNAISVAGLQAQMVALRGQLALNQQLLDIAHGRVPTLSSPIDGVVAAVNVLPGQGAKPGQTVVEVVDYHRFTVSANLPVISQTAITTGTAATITFPAFPGLSLPGSVIGVGGGTTNNGTSFLLTVDGANTSELRVRPGLNAYVRVDLPSHAAMALPKAAVQNVDLDPTVAVVTGDVVHLHRVVLGNTDGQYTEIVSGVQPGDACVLVGNQTLSEGGSVHVSKDEK